MKNSISILALLAASCAVASTKPGDESSGLVTVKANIELPNGNTITQLAYTLSCTPTPVPTQEATGVWPVITDSNGQAVANGTIGGLDPNDTCTLVLSAQDSYGLANGNIQNCAGEADGVQVGAGILGVSLVCNDSVNVAGPDSTGNLTVTVTAQGSEYRCSGIKWYTSAQYDSPDQFSFYLNMAVSVPTSPQTVTWSSDDPSVTWYNHTTNEWTPVITLSGDPLTDPITAGTDLPGILMACNAQGSFNVTLTVQDTTAGLMVDGQPWTCPAATDTFQVNCY